MEKHDTAFHIVRVGMGITFLWIGVLIWQEPLFWGGFLQPWAVDLIPIPLKQVMIGTAVLDMVIGFLFLTNIWTWVAGLLASAHLTVVLTTSGIDAMTVRDIGLLGAAIGLFWSATPKHVKKKVAQLAKPHKTTQGDNADE